jgi:hypothetical protein
MDALGGGNPYEILQLKEGPASTDQDIKKASEGRSISYHRVLCAD